MTVRILQGDCRERMRELPEASVHTGVTSPPYWGLRDYVIPPSMWGGDPACAHEWMGEGVKRRSGGTNASALGSDHHANGLTPETIAAKVERRSLEASKGESCARCSAWRGVLGMEPSPDLYIAHMVEVFREAHFATFPPELIEPCIRAGTSSKGCCPKCLAGWVRSIEKVFQPQVDVAADKGVRGAGEGDAPMFAEVAAG